MQQAFSWSKEQIPRKLYMYQFSDINSSIFSHETGLSTPPMGFITDSGALSLSQLALFKPCDLFHVVHWLSNLYNTCLQAPCIASLPTELEQEWAKEQLQLILAGDYSQWLVSQSHSCHALGLLMIPPQCPEPLVRLSSVLVGDISQPCCQRQ